MPPIEHLWEIARYRPPCQPVERVQQDTAGRDIYRHGYPCDVVVHLNTLIQSPAGEFVAS